MKLYGNDNRLKELQVVRFCQDRILFQRIRFHHVISMESPLSFELLSNAMEFAPFYRQQHTEFRNMQKLFAFCRILKRMKWNCYVSIENIATVSEYFKRFSVDFWAKQHFNYCIFRLRKKKESGFDILQQLEIADLWRWVDITQVNHYSDVFVVVAVAVEITSCRNSIYVQHWALTKE